MKRGDTTRFVVAGILVTAAIALFASPLASSAPDGLERVAEDTGFADTARDHALSDGPVADYQLRGVADERLSTGLSGLIGVMLTFGVGLAVFTGLRVARERRERQPTAPRRRGGDHSRGP